MSIYCFGISYIILGKNVAKVKKLTEFEQCRIVELQKPGLFQCATTGEIGHSKTPVGNFLKDLEQ